MRRGERGARRRDRGLDEGAPVPRRRRARGQDGGRGEKPQKFTRMPARYSRPVTL